MSEDICTLCRDKRCDGYLCQASRENLLEIAYRQNSEVAELEARRALLEKKYTRVVDAGNTTIQNLEAENERLRVRVADYAQQTHDAVDAHTKLLEDYRKLEAENAELRAEVQLLSLGPVTEERTARLWEALKKQLAWFEERAQFVDEVMTTDTISYVAMALIRKWEAEHPKPEGGT